MKKIYTALSILILTILSFNYQKLNQVRAESYVFETYYGNILGAKDKEIKGQTKKADVGKVQEVKGNKVVIDDSTDKKKLEVTLDSQTKIIGKDRKAVKVKDIKINDKIALIASDSGEVASGSGKIKKIQKIYVKSASDSAQMKRQAVHGVIKSISGATITITHQIQQDRTYTIITLPSTTVFMKSLPTATVSNLKVGDRIMAVGDTDSKGSIIARKIHVIPGVATGVMSKQKYASKSADLTTPAATATATITRPATPSATIAVTPSLTPTQSITPTPTTGENP